MHVLASLLAVVKSIKCSETVNMSTSVADLGGFVRVRTNPPFFQVINLLQATFPATPDLRSVFSMETQHSLTPYRQQGHSCRGGSFLFISLRLVKLGRCAKATVQQTRNNAHRTQPHPLLQQLICLWFAGVMTGIIWQGSSLIRVLLLS